MHCSVLERIGALDAACQRHDILVTPHKRNEVERSVGRQRLRCSDGVLKTRNYLLIE
jgi:hypothetical protein